MESERGSPGLDELRADLQARAGAVFEAPAHLHRDRDVDRSGDRGDNTAGALGVVEQGRAGTGLRHLPDRAAEVDVDDVGAGVDDRARGLGHQRRLRAEDLHRERMLVGGDSQIAERAFVAVVNARAADHLRAHEAGAEAATLPPERLHADARHRREHEARRHLDAANPPGRTQIQTHRSAENRSRGGPLRITAVGATIPAREGACSASCSFRRRAGVAKEVILTKEGYEKLKQEIEYLSTEKRREVADRIRVAREFGDIAENSEYDDAKNEQALVEHRIAMLEERLLSARVIEKKDIAKDVVSVGSTVKLRDMGANKTVEYRIVGSAEANPAEQKLSNESPVGKAILGKKKGEVVEVAAPRGSLKFKILEIKAA